MTYAVVWELDT